MEENLVFQFLIIFLSLILIDSVYLFLIGEKFMGMIRQIQAENVIFRKWSAVVCYILLSSRYFGFYLPTEEKPRLRLFTWSYHIWCV